MPPRCFQPARSVIWHFLSQLKNEWVSLTESSN
jgi:hypothetical protein